jgi:lysophospholipase L1-like esterase
MRRSLKLKLALAAFSIAIAFVVGEIGLRALGYYGVRGADVEKLRLVDDPVVDYRRFPDISWVSNNLRYDINSEGWRDREHELAKPPGTYRILSVGDSVTNGHGVESEEIYTRQLETLLNADPPSDLDYEVILITLGALNTEQEVHLAEAEGLRYDPDLIVVGYVLNDPAEGASLRRDRERARQRSMIEVIKEEAQRSSVIHLAYRTGQRLMWGARRAFGEAEVATYATDDYFARLHRSPDSWARVTGAFDRLERLSAETEVAVLVVVFPVLYDLESYPWAEAHGQVASAARERGFHVLDLLPAYQGHDPNDLQVVEGDHVHPNAAGHRIAAGAIERYLREQIRPSERR